MACVKASADVALGRVDRQYPSRVVAVCTQQGYPRGLQTGQGRDHSDEDEAKVARSVLNRVKTWPGAHSYGGVVTP